MIRTISRASMNYIGDLLAKKLHSLPLGPLFMTFELTRDCNLQCQGCDIWRTKNKESGWLDEELEREEIFRLLEDLKDMGLLLVYLSGGEPLLRDDIFEVIRKSRELGLGTTLVTNGTLLTEKNVKKLLSSGAYSVIVSLDGPDPEAHDEIRGVEGTFEKATEGIKRLRKLGSDEVNIGINSMVTTKNLKVSEMAKLTGRLGADGVRLLPYHYEEYPQNAYSSQSKELMIKKEDDVRLLEREIQKFRKISRKLGIYTNYRTFLKELPEYYRNGREIKNCYAGNLFCAMDSKGNFFPCFPVESGENIREKSFKDVWSSERLEELRYEIIEEGKCERCFEACYKEMSMRASPTEISKNLVDQLRELKFFLGI